MEEIGKIGTYKIYWDKWSGEVRVGNETCPNKAYSKDGAMEVARNYIASI